MVKPWNFNESEKHFDEKYTKKNMMKEKTDC